PRVVFWGSQVWLVTLLTGKSRKDTRSVRDAELQLLEVLGIDGRRGAVHERGCARRLGKRDRVANGFASVEEDDQAVQSQSDAPMGRRAVLERLEQESELLLRLLGLHPDRAHDALLDVLSMDPDAPARELVSVRREIVELRP